MGETDYLWRGYQVEKEVSVFDVPIVREFPDVFLEVLSGVPPER